MRLSALARKLGIKPTEIIELLKLEGGSVHGNTKLTEDQQKLIFNSLDLPLEEEGPEDLTLPDEEDKLDQAQAETHTPEEKEYPDSIEQQSEEEVDIEQETGLDPEPAIAMEEVESPVKETERLVMEVSELLEAETLEFEEDQEILIKAPKQYLPGLSVKGKIELPEKKVKPTEEKDDAENLKRSRRHAKKRRTGNPIAVERARKEREAEKKKRELKLKEKQKKKERYKEMVATKVTKPVHKKRTKKVQAPSDPVTKIAPKRNLFQRFWEWMNT